MSQNAEYVGVILGVDRAITEAEAERMGQQLRDIFPEVRFAVVPNAHSVAFTVPARIDRSGGES